MDRQKRSETDQWISVDGKRSMRLQNVNAYVWTGPYRPANIYQRNSNSLIRLSIFLPRDFVNMVDTRSSFEFFNCAILTQVYFLSPPYTSLRASPTVP